MILEDFEKVCGLIKTKLPEYLEERGINTNKNFSCLDPKHEDMNASCGLIPPNRTVAHCFGCSKIFDIFTAAHLLEAYPISGSGFVEKTIPYLAERFDIEISFKELTPEQKLKVQAYQAYAIAASYIIANPPEKAIEEMRRRNWEVTGASQRGIGGINGYDEYIEYLLSFNFTLTFLEEIDLTKRALFSEHNLIFTIYDTRGRPCGFNARNLNYTPETKHEAPKYINTKSFFPDSPYIIYEKSKILYNLNNAKNTKGTIYIMEGCGDTETAIQNGILNVVAICGSALTEKHALQLSIEGKTDLTIAMDGDEPGIKSTEKVIEVLSSRKEFSIYVVKIPDLMDPDEYIRKTGAKGFYLLRKWTAFEWKLDQYDSRIDPLVLKNEIIPIIAGNPSPIEREKMAISLSEKICISKNSIMEEISILLSEEKEIKKKEEKKLLEELAIELKRNPSDWRLHINRTVQVLDAMTENVSDKAYSPSIYLRELETFKEDEEEVDNKSSFTLPNWREFSDAIAGDWRSTLNVLGGSANVGKTSLMGNIAIQLAAQERDDAFILFHSIDDTVRQFTSRLVCHFAMEKMPPITLNMIKRPNSFPETKRINEARDYGYQKLKKLVSSERLLVRGGENHYATIEYAEELIKYYIKQYPKKKLIYFLDNFHRLRDFSSGDERMRFKNLSQRIKDMAKKYDIGVWCTMEYNKQGSVAKPTNNSISESIAMEYDANLIAHLYNDLHTRREYADTYFLRTDQMARQYQAPRIEILFGKNKLNEFKGSLFFDFYTEQSLFVPVPITEVERGRELHQNAIKAKKQNGAADNQRANFYTGD